MCFTPLKIVLAMYPLRSPTVPPPIETIVDFLSIPFFNILFTNNS